MNKNPILIIGSGLSGLSAAITCAEKGLPVLLVSPYPSERSQSVMAAGGINASPNDDKDSPSLHAEDTCHSACGLENKEDIDALCARAPEILQRLEKIGVVFSRTESGAMAYRKLGGHSQGRSAFAGAATGKILVTALTSKCREYECKGLISRKFGLWFYEALIHENTCYGAIFYNELTRKPETIYAPVVILATGGQNLLFGKTTGSLICNGYPIGKLFEQGAALRNLEFIQYHPTTIETDQKRMLISEAARGEGGRLFYEQDGKRVYFMEDQFGPNGNLMTRDVVSRCIYNAPSQVYLDITFLGAEKIHQRLEEIANVCKTYLDLDVTKEPIPVSPSVHFFMGGLKVDKNHRTTIGNLFAVGECASKYHGANRLGGNSLLAALYSGLVAGEAVAQTAAFPTEVPDFSQQIAQSEALLLNQSQSQSSFPARYLYKELANIMNEDLGIVRYGENLEKGLKSIEFYANVADKITFDPDMSLTEVYSLKPMLLLARAILQSALYRQESRGAHYRSDFTKTRDEFAHPSIASYNKADGSIRISPEGAERP